MGSQPLLSVGGTLQALAFTVGGGALAFVCASFSFVSRQLAIVGDPVPFRGYPIPLGSEPFPSCQLSPLPFDRRLLALPGRLLALILLRRASIQPSEALACRTLNT
ncbi:hypothetical protein MGAST_22555 [Mycobacterium gastri 'Wayne']|uniref:Uncharacterized protein n=1 Tax=Mycobacterium gastri TaxID=1777 RepID=A0A1X1VHB2_MYCGS|nr:hypothetical protein MGAST_22555 [Mycobacterium gastri 'Wayne']ORV68359.1 hypothetical protein AWC07_08465 [Mycobacterium gastri]